MLRKAKAKAKEGLRSVNAETKRYLGTKGRGHVRPRQPTHSPGSAAVSFRGVSDDFEAILNDDSDFTNQFDEFESSDSPGTGAVGGLTRDPSPCDVSGATSGESGSKHVDDSLFSDPLFPEPDDDRPESCDPLSGDFDPLFEEKEVAALPNEDSPEGNETDTTTAPESQDTLPNENSSSQPNTITMPSTSNNCSEVAPPQLVSARQEQLRPDSPLFSDDTGSASKEDKLAGASILVAQPSDEKEQDMQEGEGDMEEDIFGDKPDPQLTGGVNHHTEKPSTPELPDIDELEHKIAINRVGGIPVQDFFSSEESPFSSLASSYEGEKELVSQFVTATLPPPSDGTQQIRSIHTENEWSVEVASTDEKEGSRDQEREPGSEEAYSIDKELEILLTPKLKPNTVEGRTSSDMSTVHSAAIVRDDPLHCDQQESSRNERARSHLDSGVFEQSVNSVVLKSTPEREGTEKHEDDLFIIDEDHFKDEESTPVVSRKPMTKGSSYVEVSQTKKSLSSTLSAPEIVPVGGKVSASPPIKRSAVKTTPPPRPAMSPKLKQKMMQKHQTPSSGVDTHGRQQEGEARKRIVQPLEQAPPSSSVHDDSPTRLESTLGSEAVTTVSTKSSSNDTPSLSSKTEERRIPADDLFLEDSLISSKAGEIPVDTEKPAIEQTEAETAPSSDEEETGYYFVYHLIFAMCLYFYYSLNIFPYLSGFFAGFFVLYLTVGSVFIFYVQTVEKYQPGEGKEDKLLEPSQEFTERMHVDFENLSVYKSKRFTATLTYDPATHHPTQRMKTVVHLVNDFEVYLKVYNDHAHSNTVGPMVDVTTDIRDCTLSLVPDEVAKNRKRRWSKKFPIMIFNPPPNTYRVYLFSPHARDKEDWFRRLKHANNGLTSKQVIERGKRFFAYMESYFPRNHLPSTDSTNTRQASVKRPTKPGSQRKPPPVARVRYSVNQDHDEVSKAESFESVSFKASSKPQQQQTHQQPSTVTTQTRSSVSSNVDDHQLSHTRSMSSSVDSEFEVIPHPLKLSKTSDLKWLNAVAARLCWDIWHEQRWKDWVTTRIQKKLIRVKTPSFMEQLRLTDVKLGNDMPVVQRLREGPKLDLRGIWVYLDVTYSGKFVMTIETKMKLGKENPSEETEGQQMSAMTRNKESGGLPQSAPHRGPGHHTSRSTGRGLTHHHAAKMLGSSVDLYEHEIDSGSDDEESATGIAVNPLEAEATAALHSHDHQDHQVHLPGGKKEKLKSMVSKITKRVANTKIVQRAAQKVSSYPLVLTVEVRSLDGILAVNIPPPPTDTIWYGFKGPPNLSLVAKPRLGNREVKLSRVTHWIERKLRELVNKKLVLPEMEDLVIPILNSGIPEDELKPISSDSAPSAT